MSGVRSARVLFAGLVVVIALAGGFGVVPGGSLPAPARAATVTAPRSPVRAPQALTRRYPLGGERLVRPGSGRGARGARTQARATGASRSSITLPVVEIAAAAVAGLLALEVVLGARRRRRPGGSRWAPGDAPS